MKRSQNVHYRRALNQQLSWPSQLNTHAARRLIYAIKKTQWEILTSQRHLDQASTEESNKCIAPQTEPPITYQLISHSTFQSPFAPRNIGTDPQYRRETSLGHSLEIPSPRVISGIEAFILDQYDCRCLLLLRAICCDFSRFFSQNKQEIPAFVK